jgi:hypothetical protein
MMPRRLIDSRQNAHRYVESKVATTLLAYPTEHRHLPQHGRLESLLPPPRRHLRGWSGKPLISLVVGVPDG